MKLVTLLAIAWISLTIILSIVIIRYLKVKVNMFNNKANLLSEKLIHLIDEVQIITGEIKESKTYKLVVGKNYNIMGTQNLMIEIMMSVPKMMKNNFYRLMSLI